MRGRVFAVIFLICATINSIAANGKCELWPTEDERSIVYLCVEVTFDHVKDIASQADWIQFSVSRLNIPARAFARFPLRKLFFYNCDIRYIDPNAFEGLADLQRLTFYGSKINVLSASWFRGLKSLTHLSLEKNNLVYIEPKTFLEIPNLLHLDIEDNNLNCLPEHALAPLRRLKHVRIGKNPWLCTCYTELVKWMLNRGINFGTKNETKMRFECMVGSYTSKYIERREVYRNSSTWEGASLTVSEPGNGTCIGKTLSILSPTPDNVRSIKLSGVKISTIPEFAFFQFGNSLTSLDLTNCSIKEIHPDAFAGLPKLERLILFNNSLSTVKAEWFRDLRSLKHLELDRNGIEHIDLNVFPLLDKVETLSLQQNAIECLPADTVGLMKNLKKVNIAKNPWNCGCLNNFRAWLDKKLIAYHVSLGECSNEMGQANGGQYGSKYWNSSVQHNFVGNGTTTSYKNFTETHTYTEFHDDFPSDFGNYYHRNQGSTKNEGDHQHNKRSPNDAHRITERQQPQQRDSGSGCQTSNIQGLQQSTYNCPPTCRRVAMQQFYTRYFYECLGGTLFGLNAVLDVAESIKFEYCTIPIISNYAFARFGSNLRSLKFYYCKIEKIEPQAFAGLVNLQELIVHGNHIHEVGPAWFESTNNLRRLILTQNSITRIDNGVFRLLPNLEHFSIADNQLNCIGIDVLFHMSRLRRMELEKNPWSCLCRKKLAEWMNEHNVDYNRDFLTETSHWDCDVPILFPPTTGQIILPTFPPTPPIPPYQPRSTIAPFQPPLPTQTFLPPRPTPTFQPSPPTPTFRPPPPPPSPSSHLLDHCKLDPLNPSRCRCVGGGLFILDQIPSNVERIVIVNSTISHLPADSFARFKNLKEMLFYNCSIRDIDHFAFRGLHKLQLLVFHNNIMSTIRSEWFRDLTALTELDLTGNHVTEIDGDTFEYLPNLRILTLRDNGIQCIYTRSLNTLTRLERVSMQNNPWKWRCLEELTQFLDARNVSYTNFDSYRGKRITCELNGDGNPGEHSGTTNTSISTVNVLCVSIAMLIFTKF